MAATAQKIEPVENAGTLDDSLIELQQKLIEVTEAIQQIEIPCPDMTGGDWGIVGDGSQLVNLLIDAVNQYNGHAE